jgi:hypothetical protein
MRRQHAKQPVPALQVSCAHTNMATATRERHGAVYRGHCTAAQQMRISSRSTLYLWSTFMIFSRISTFTVTHQLSWTNSIVQTEVMARDNNFPVAKLTPINWNPTSVPLTRISTQQFPCCQYLTYIYLSRPRRIINELTLAEWMQGRVKGCVLYNKDVLRICHKFCFCKRRIQLPFPI